MKIKRKSYSLTPKDKVRLMAMIKGKVPASKIAVELGINQSTVKYYKNPAAYLRRHMKWHNANREKALKRMRSYSRKLK